MAKQHKGMHCCGCFATGYKWKRLTTNQEVQSEGLSDTKTWTTGYSFQASLPNLKNVSCQQSFSPLSQSVQGKISTMLQVYPLGTFSIWAVPQVFIPECVTTIPVLKKPTGLESQQLLPCASHRSRNELLGVMDHMKLSLQSLQLAYCSSWSTNNAISSALNAILTQQQNIRVLSIYLFIYLFTYTVIF